MEEIFNVATHFFYAILMFLLFLSIGKIIIREKLVVNNFSLYFDVFISVLTGMTIVIFYMTFLSIFGIVYKPLVYLLFFGFFGIKYFKYSKKIYFNVILLFIMFIPILSLTLYPPTHWDDISYHLPIAQSLLKIGNLSGNEFLRYPYFPFNAEMLFTFGMIFGVKTSQIISSISLFTLCIGIYGYIHKRTASIILSIFSFIVMISSQILIFLSSVSYVDILLATFVTAAIILVVEYFETGNMYILYLSATFFGIAAGVKYTALIICVIAGILFILAIFLYKIEYKNLFKFIATVSVICIPWYIRTLIYTGNPVWPFMSSVFGTGDIWNEDDYTGQFGDFTANGVEKNFINFLKIPKMLSIDNYEVIALNVIVWIGFLLFIVMKKKKSQIFLLLFIILYTITWFLSINLPRYYAPILPVLLLVCSIGFIHLINQIQERRMKNVILVLLIIGLSITPIKYINTKVQNEGFPPLTTIKETEYLRGKLATYDGTIYSQKLNGKTYGLLNENMYYYANGKSIGDWFGIARYSTTLGLLYDEQKIHEHLKSLNVNYFLINKGRLTEEQNSLLDYNIYFAKVYEDSSTIIFRLNEKN
ncbi:ArnT family glycosyltransferase [Lysinibacillus piscis]|uniref:DUF8201 domain-containing protein n=1 Tax=Lysinibacillus piscis TaxID=2518931 RepID=A0ABQ5NHP7_9BACI|nr:hypothetical protein [Lysinibacillus sp. KH24]GLC87885.1 hypothetical protein LYSBPC_10120 [Lysinibacillus sp. KH24]